MNFCGSCDTATLASNQTENPENAIPGDDSLRDYGQTLSGGFVEYVFSVPSVHCGKCIASIESRLNDLKGVENARVNLTLKRVTVRLEGDHDPKPIVDQLEAIGFPAIPVDPADLADVSTDSNSSAMLRALAVAGFAAGNVMLLSVSVWSGADSATRDLFHLISALIAVPAVAYSGQVFFRSAWSALRVGTLNMDVPISLAVILATAMSMFEVFNGGEEAYFDAAVSLLFFLLIGRYLDHRMRDRARSAVIGLSRFAVKGATRIDNEGELHYVPVSDVEPGMDLRVLAGERVPVDAIVTSGHSDLDRSLVTGESIPVHAQPGARIEAGTLNMTGTLEVKARSSARDSFLAEVMRMLEAAEKGRGQYVRIANRMAQIYAPAVHLLAALTFVGWMIATSGDWHASLYTAIAVLIVTCPCALGLAVPVVHVIGASRLFEAGILMKDGSAIERLAEADKAIFDKTGTLTTGTPGVLKSTIDHKPISGVAKALALNSTHPASSALADHLRWWPALKITGITELPGHGMEGVWNDRKIRLGRAEWVREIARPVEPEEPNMRDRGLGFAIAGEQPYYFQLGETLRPGAKAALDQLRQAGLDPEILSGDDPESVAIIARALEVENWHGRQLPAEKIARIERLKKEGRKVLMVGDGLNDVPSLAAGHVSMAPASASDIGRMTADFVFTREGLGAVPFAHSIALKARRLVKQNFGLAIIYNCIAVPLAIAGFVTPLFAAIAMSASSIVVVANSLRLARSSLPELAMQKKQNRDDEESPVSSIAGAMA